jgi:hypothetical protein
VTPRAALVAVVVGGLLAIAAAGAAILLQSAPRRAGTNWTVATGAVIPLAPGQQLCEPGELLPGDTGALQIGADTRGAPGPELQASIAGPSGATLSTGTLPAGWRGGSARIPLARVVETTQNATVCLRNRGPSAVAFAGSVPDASFVIQLAGRAMLGRLRIEYMRPGRETWFQFAPTLLHRVSLAKSDLVRHWAAVGALVLMLLAIVLMTRTLLAREPAR